MNNNTDNMDNEFFLTFQGYVVTWEQRTRNLTFSILKGVNFFQ